MKVGLGILRIEAVCGFTQLASSPLTTTLKKSKCSTRSSTKVRIYSSVQFQVWFKASINYCLIDQQIKFPTSYPTSCLLGYVDLNDCLSSETYKQRVNVLLLLRINNLNYDFTLQINLKVSERRVRVWFRVHLQRPERACHQNSHARRPQNM